MSNLSGYRFTTQGGVRGTCGHSHPSASRAAACRQADYRACMARGGYSDRFVVAVDACEYNLAGEIVHIDHALHEKICMNETLLEAWEG